MDDPLDTIMTIPEVAIYLKMSKSKVYSLIQRRQMPHVRIGRNVRVRVGDLARWLEKQKDTYVG